MFDFLLGGSIGVGQELVCVGVLFESFCYLCDVELEVDELVLVYFDELDFDFEGLVFFFEIFNVYIEIQFVVLYEMSFGENMVGDDEIIMFQFSNKVDVIWFDVVFSMYLDI